MDNGYRDAQRACNRGRWSSLESAQAFGLERMEWPACWSVGRDPARPDADTSGLSVAVTTFDASVFDTGTSAPVEGKMAPGRKS